MPFSISELNIPRNVFAVPSTDLQSTYSHILKSFISSPSGKQKEEFVRDFLSYCLAKEGVGEGVGFKTYKTGERDSSYGFYNPTYNLISVREEFFSKQDKIGMLTNVLFHESHHKAQDYRQTRAKYFSPYEHEQMLSFSRAHGMLCDFKSDRATYYVNSKEVDSFRHNISSTATFLQQAREEAVASGDIKRVVFVDKQIKLCKAENECVTAKLNASISNFISNNLPTFYQKSTKAFNKYFPLAQSLDKKIPLGQEEARDAINVQNIFNLQNSTPLKDSVLATTLILGHFPQREMVERFIDFACSAKDSSTYPEAVKGLVANYVPLTKSDVTKIILANDMHKGDSSLYYIQPEFISRIDEGVWVKDLLISQGANFTHGILDIMRSSGNYKDVDYARAEQMVANYSQQPLMEVNGTPIYGCSGVLDYVFNSLKDRGIVNDSNYESSRNVLLNNLTDIVRHFDNPTPENAKFVGALHQFVANPYELQFNEPIEPYSEVTKAFEPESAQKLAEFIEATRQQNNQSVPTRTTFAPINNQGVDYKTALIEALNNLTQAINGLTEAISKSDTKTILGHLGITQKGLENNEEPVLEDIGDTEDETTEENGEAPVETDNNGESQGVEGEPSAVIVGNGLPTNSVDNYNAESAGVPTINNQVAMEPPVIIEPPCQ